MSADLERRYFVEAAAKALDVLESFNGFQEELSISEIVRRVGLNYCSAFRLLYTLEKRGYVSRAAGAKRFRLTPPRKRFRIGYAALGPDGSCSEEIARSLVLAARTQGIDLIVRDNDFSPPKALANLDAFLEERVHLVIEHQASHGAAEVIAARCQRAGVPLISIDFPHPDSYYFGVNYELAGRLSGEALADRAARADRLLIVVPRGIKAITKAYVAGIREGLGGGIEAELIVPEGPTSSDAHRAARQALEAAAAARQILIVAATEAFAMGAGRAAAKLGIDASAVSLGGGHDGRSHLMRNSTLQATVAVFPETYGERLLSIAMRILQGEQIAPAVYTEHVVLTKNNLEEYYPELSCRRRRTATAGVGHVDAIRCAV